MNYTLQQLAQLDDETLGNVFLVLHTALDNIQYNEATDKHLITIDGVSLLERHGHAKAISDSLWYLQQPTVEGCNQLAKELRKL